MFRRSLSTDVYRRLQTSDSPLLRKTYDRESPLPIFPEGGGSSVQRLLLTVHPSSSVLHNVKSPLNLNHARCYKVRHIALAILHTKKFELATLSYLQGESQIYVFHLLVKGGFLPFCSHIFFSSSIPSIDKWYPFHIIR